MKKQGVPGPPSIGVVLGLTLAALVAAGCCSTPRVSDDDAIACDLTSAEAIPILVTLAAEDGDALAAARESVLARLRSAMSTEAFAAVRVYETLPVIALAATSEVIALLLMLPEVRRIEADQEFATWN